MKAVRITAAVLFYLSRIASLLYLITAAYATFIALLSINGPPAWLPINIVDNRFEIFYPFTQKPFLLGDYTASFFIFMLLIIWGYGLFLWLLSEIFNTFRQQKLFTQYGFVRLSRFYMANLTVPGLMVIILMISGFDVTDMIIITFLHAVIGVFAFFMAAIFKQGLLLQEEQDLTL